MQPANMAGICRIRKNKHGLFFPSLSQSGIKPRGPVSASQPSTMRSLSPTLKLGFQKRGISGTFAAMLSSRKWTTGTLIL